MYLLAMLSEALENPEICLIMADFIEDKISDKHQEKNHYIKRLRNYKTIQLRTLTECVAKFGTKQERHQIRKVVKNALTNKTNTYYLKGIQHDNLITRLNPIDRIGFAQGKLLEQVK